MYLIDVDEDEEEESISLVVEVVGTGYQHATGISIPNSLIGNATVLYAIVVAIVVPLSSLETELSLLLLVPVDIVKEELEVVGNVLALAATGVVAKSKLLVVINAAQTEKDVLPIIFLRDVIIGNLVVGAVAVLGILLLLFATVAALLLYRQQRFLLPRPERCNAAATAADENENDDDDENEEIIENPNVVVFVVVNNDTTTNVDRITNCSRRMTTRNMTYIFFLVVYC